MSEDYSITITVDASGTRCPIPLLRAKQALKALESGAYLKVLSTDPSAKGDFEAMLRHLPHELVSYRRREGVSCIDEFIILKGEL